MLGWPFDAGCNPTGEYETSAVYDGGTAVRTWYRDPDDEGVGISGAPAGPDRRGRIMRSFVWFGFESLRTVLRSALTAEGAKGIAIVTYGGWNDIPSPFLAKFGFEMVGPNGMTTLMLRKAAADARVAFVPVERTVPISSSTVEVETVISGMCPSAAQYYRRLLSVARTLSDKVVTRERVLANRDDAIRYGRENTVYVDGREPFSGGFRTQAFSDFVARRLAALV